MTNNLIKRDLVEYGHKQVQQPGEPDAHFIEMMVYQLTDTVLIALDRSQVGFSGPVWYSQDDKLGPLLCWRFTARKAPSGDGFWRVHHIKMLRDDFWGTEMKKATKALKALHNDNNNQSS